MYLQSEQRLGAIGLGACVVPKEAVVRKLVATDADLEAIGREMGKGRGLVIREVRTTLESTIRWALTLIGRAESQLKKPRWTGEGGDAMRRRFRDAFGYAPEYVQPGEGWEAGEMVRERLRCAAKIMAEGDIEFVAWGPGSCPWRRDWSKRIWAVVQPGRYRICLGQVFWHAAGRGDSEEMATTLLHECLHIYFDTIRHRRERWAFNTATCYERYVLLCNGIDIPPSVNVPCPSKLAGAGLGTPAKPSDTEKSLALLKKALELDPPSKGKVRIAILSLPLPSAKPLHDLLEAGIGPLGKLFQKLDADTRKWVLDTLWEKYRAHKGSDA